MPDPASHLYEVQVDVGNVNADTVALQMPVWSPGRYARMDFARNVLAFAAESDGRPLAWDKASGSLWRVMARGARRVRVRYRVFAGTLSGTFSVLDSAHANWNGASLFVYVDGHKPDPVRLVVTPPAGWHVINGASKMVDQLEFTFPTYDQLVDTPTEVAPSLEVDTLRVDGRLIRIVVHRNGGDSTQRARFVRDVRRIVETENRVVGPPPLDSYTFLFNLGFPGGDGMEHLASTQIIDAKVWAAEDMVLAGIGTAAHEYFHAWNVKRIRPAALGPFDYSREQYQPSLWVAEGWTQYYGQMTLHRAGIVGKDSLYGMLAEVVRYNSETPARHEMSARAASFNAPFWDGAAAPMATDRPSQFISYYTKGEALALLLDLKIRGATHGSRSLDDVLRLLKTRTWDAPSTSYYLQGRGYTESDVERAASDVAGQDLHPWFERYVGGVEELPWAETLALAGLTLTVRQVDGTQAYELAESPAATPEQIRLREAWLKGS
jgi:predicted metalloprotease with PDZ domain